MKNSKSLNSNHAIRIKDPENHTPNIDQMPSPTDTQQRVFYLVVLAIVLSCAALFMASKTSSSTSPNFVVVDMNQLLRQKAASLVKSKGLEGEDDKREMQLESYAKRIREVIENYASENKVTVVSKGAVFGGGLKEVTDAVSSRL